MHRLNWILVGLTTALGACDGGCAPLPVWDTSAETGTEIELEPWVDEWELVGSGAAAGLELLSIGGRRFNDNFENRGDIEVYYVSGIDEITVEMQRFTIGPSNWVDVAFSRMHPWLYDLAEPAAPDLLSPDVACWAPGATACYVRVFYDGLFQPVRDGANFRVTIPAGWTGALELVTTDNLEDGLERYPDRSDIWVDGLAGSLSVDLDSGNVAVRLDPNLAHYAGCPDSDECVLQGHAPACGCVEPTAVSLSNRAFEASNMTVDVGNVDHWYTLELENRAALNGGDSSCEATIDCSAFADCQLDPMSEALTWRAQAEINYPGEPAVAGAGIHISLISDTCDDVAYVNGPQDYENPDMPNESRGHLRVCAGCL